MTHDLVRDAISQIVGMAISAAVTAVATLGIGAPAIAIQVGTRVSALVPRISTTITKVVAGLGKLRGLLDELSSMAQNALRMLAQWGGRTGGSTRAVDELVEQIVDTRSYLKPGARPSFRNGVPETVWENNRGPDGLVRDPNQTDEVIDWTPGTPRNGV